MKWDGGWLQREGVPGVAKLMLCDHIITFRHTVPHVPIMTLQSRRLGFMKHIGLQIQALSDAEYHFQIEAWGFIPLPISWIYSMDRESAMQEQDGGTHTEVERGDGRWVASHSASALIVASKSSIGEAGAEDTPS